MQIGRSAMLFLMGVCLTVVIPHAVFSQEMNEFPSASREFRAVWVATVANIDFPSAPSLTTDQQKAELKKIVELTHTLNMNAIIFQVRPMCDALYASALEPWSYYLTGEMGKAPEPYYDPLAFLIEEAHKQGIEVHAWFNPYRALHPTCRSAIASNHVSNTMPDVVKKYGSYRWLDPGEKKVQDHSINVILNVVKRYDVDGVHLDDYFYPYKEKDKDGKIIDFPDDASWKKYKVAGGTLNRNDWRRQNVNTFIERMYRSVKSLNPRVKVGISPFGIWRPGYPRGVVGLDPYEELYADSRLWLEKGWVDYFTPQLYWTISSKGQPYNGLLQWWVAQNKMQRHIWPGNYTSKYEPDEIINQVKATRNQQGATGNVHYSVKPFLKNRDGLNEKIKGSVYSNQALVPPSPWLDSYPPPKPVLTVQPEKGGKMLVTAKPSSQEAVFNWVLYMRANGTWGYRIYPGYMYRKLVMRFDPEQLPEIVAVTAVDRTGNESPSASVQLKP